IGASSLIFCHLSQLQSLASSTNPLDAGKQLSLHSVIIFQPANHGSVILRDPMHPSTPSRLFKILCITALSFVVSGVSHARDLSLPPYDWATTAALQNNPELANDPLSQFTVDSDTDIWMRIRHGFAIPDLVDNPLVNTQT